MKKILSILLVTTILIVPTFFLTGCGKNNDPTVIHIGASSNPHAIILEQVRDDLRDRGFQLQVTVFSDWTQQNPALARGDILANYFQHRPFLNNWNAQSGNNLTYAAGIHFEPLGIFPGQRNSIAALQPGDQIIFPNDTTNAARALTLLEYHGLVTWNAAANADRSNPANWSSQFTLTPVLAATLVATRPDSGIAVINGNWAAPAGLLPYRLVYETAAQGSEFTNIIAIRDGYENDARITALVEVLQTNRIRDFILNNWDGAIQPNFI
ncbi:MAG: MetQ/NlpA family ABC transporter substrate-binding protein [Firmicutes bacterium]|nr:MetQ/NlpA family ABC transporter substrate-binding protein [Bacillota bacterium]